MITQIKHNLLNNPKKNAVVKKEPYPTSVIFCTTHIAVFQRIINFSFNFSHGKP
jgi:hypothetical protein